MADDDDLRYPIWVYIVVSVVGVLAVLWAVHLFLGIIAGLVELIIIVVLAMAIIGWAVNRESDRQ